MHNEKAKFIQMAQFKLNCAFQVTGRHFFLVGEITKGEIKIGNYIDLTSLDLNLKPRIEAIEFALKRQDGNVYEDIGLGINELSEYEKELLKNKSSLLMSFDIISER